MAGRLPAAAEPVNAGPDSDENRRVLTRRREALEREEPERVNPETHEWRENGERQRSPSRHLWRVEVQRLVRLP